MFPYSRQFIEFDVRVFKYVVVLRKFGIRLVCAVRLLFAVNLLSIRYSTFYVFKVFAIIVRVFRSRNFAVHSTLLFIKLRCWISICC